MSALKAKKRPELTCKTRWTATGVVGIEIVRQTLCSVATAVVEAWRQLRGTVGSWKGQLTHAPVSDHKIDALSAVRTRVWVTVVDLNFTVQPCITHRLKLSRSHDHTREWRWTTDPLDSWQTVSTEWHVPLSNSYRAYHIWAMVWSGARGNIAITAL